MLTARKLVHRRLTRALLTLSRVEGPKYPPLSTKTLPQFFADEILAKNAEQPALVSKHELADVHATPWTQKHVAKDLHWDFSEFHAHIEALARGLQDMGIEKGDRVGVVMGNSSVYAMLQWACARIGAIIVTINPAYKMHELLAMLNLVSVKALFLVPRLRGSHYTGSLLRALPELHSAKPNSIHLEGLPSLRSLIIADNTGDPSEFRRERESLPCALDFREVLQWTPQALRSLDELHKDDIINLQFTSGTTGLPKAVSLTHSNLLNNGRSIGACMRIGPGDKLCNVPPLFHCFGLVLGNLAAWTHGACIVYAAETYDPRANLRALVEEQCAAVHGVPTHFLGLLDELETAPPEVQSRLSRLRTGIAAGSPIPIELMRQLIAKLNLVDLSIAYGMTETSPVSFQTTPDDPLIKRVETVGKVQPHVKAKILDEQGNVVPIGQPGELCVSGYLLHKGYWEDAEQTASVVRRHDDEPETQWMHTGDVGIMDEEGYLRIVGRSKDVIIRGGENLFPVQIENAIGQYHDVHEVAVVAVPHAKYGECVGAWIQLRSTATGAKGLVPGQIARQMLREYVAATMNPQNAPTYIWFLEEGESLPKTASGKVQKNILREWSVARLRQQPDSAHVDAPLIQV
ncbi:acetyl-CoA synthetase-like protein [Exidia glandulosa HHB12029]|uniref:Acetyl-CoA synthetase-like protein n=1 Tax=Exidia glandulosa HHB12029 TaxID=1314781 RepID=A0A165P1N5_EXIGL|nr:acetyl-CoA synthetase-like protein [Exidia glandulosa HHB12029]